MKLGVIACAIVVVGCICGPLPAHAGVSDVQASQIAAYQRRHEAASPRIQSKEQLDAYRRTTSLADSPLGALSPGARQRFVSTIRFTPRGIGGFGYAELLRITPLQAYKILCLFGLQDYFEHFSDKYRQDSGHGTTIANTPSGGRASAGTPAIENRFNRLYALDNSTAFDTEQGRAAAMRRRYAALFAGEQNPQALSSYKDADVRLFFRAAILVADRHQASPDRYIADARRDIDRLHERDVATPQNNAAMIRAYLKAHRFADAREFARRYSLSDMDAIPKVYKSQDFEPGRPAELVIASDANRAVAKNIDPNQLEIVVIADPGCHFCVAAGRAIRNNPSLGPIFSRHAKWLAPAGASVNFKAVRLWNADHPDQSMAVAYRQAAWPMITGWFTPQFYFFRNGQVVDHVTGWLPDKTPARLKKAAEDIDLL